MKWLALAALLVPAAAWCDRPLPLFDARDLTPYWESEHTKAPDGRPLTPAVVSPFHVLDQDGRRVSQADLDGKISVVNFFYGQCGTVCPLMMQSIQKLDRKLRQAGADGPLRIFSFSVTPETDTPTELRAYAKSRGIDPSHWKLLTGSHDEIYRLGREVFRADQSRGASGSFIHSSNLYVVDARKRLRGVYDSASPQQMAYLAEDVRKLEREP